MDISWVGVGTVLSFITGLIGVGVGWGVSKQKTKALILDVNKIKEGGAGGTSLYVSRQDCNLYQQNCRGGLCNQITLLEQTLKKTHEFLPNVIKKIDDLQKIAIYDLSQKGLSLSEIKDIINGK